MPTPNEDPTRRVTRRGRLSGVPAELRPVARALLAADLGAECWREAADLARHAPDLTDEIVWALLYLANPCVTETVALHMTGPTEAFRAIVAMPTVVASTLAWNRATPVEVIAELVDVHLEKLTERVPDGRVLRALAARPDLPDEILARLPGAAVARAAPERLDARAGAPDAELIAGLVRADPFLALAHVRHLARLVMCSPA